MSNSTKFPKHVRAKTQANPDSLGKLVAVRIHPDTYKEIVKIADAEGVLVSEVIRTFFRLGVENYRRNVDRNHAEYVKGLTNVAKLGPPDKNNTWPTKGKKQG